MDAKSLENSQQQIESNKRSLGIEKAANGFIVKISKNAPMIFTDIKDAFDFVEKFFKGIKI